MLHSSPRILESWAPPSLREAPFLPAVTCTPCSQGHAQEAQPHSPCSGQLSMPHSQPSEVMLSLLEMVPCHSLGGIHCPLPFQLPDGSVFSFSMLSKALPTLRTRFIQGALAFTEQLRLCPVQESVRQRNSKGQAVGLEHRGWGVGKKKKKQNAFIAQEQILPRACTQKLY